ncbi:unnamed protein product [Medioppia subpectinata]|uniref:Uncharacterized protein n=1 Tax=Medioppia subpectinata TaxID=1979941 RepID=A0A7R9KTV5_9ACAR|nr:unnamed protein product [Medioppia subpectinata]CAG2109636.1 unnamed protein product [Medioppia subpectinata]
MEKMRPKIRNRFINDLVNNRLKRQNNYYVKDSEIRVKKTITAVNRVTHRVSRVSDHWSRPQPHRPRHGSPDYYDRHYGRHHTADDRSVDRHSSGLQYLRRMTIEEKMVGLNGSERRHYVDSYRPTHPMSTPSLPMTNRSQTPQTAPNRSQSNLFGDIFDTKSFVNPFDTQSVSCGESGIEFNECDPQMNESIDPLNDGLDTNSMNLNEIPIEHQLMDQFCVQYKEVFDNVMESYSIEGKEWAQRIDPLRGDLVNNLCQQFKHFIVTNGSPLNRNWILNAIDLRLETNEHCDQNIQFNTQFIN